eukprot:TRINITY_DN6366_c0_g1_i4.p1 TRINITY_DN6366_c0_g1~~TRINITY_DN6366_c0_g1_i4.p1  ORF type:complete len:315 (-),score=52.37 TRINITY_DN6366_c0_g1_i4:60-1004(-)
MSIYFFFFQAEDGIRDFCLSRGLGDVYKRQTQEYMGFGKVELFIGPGEEEYSVMISKTVASGFSFEEQWTDALKKGVYEHDNIAKVYGYRMKKDKTICTDLQNLSIMVEYFKRDLNGEIKIRKAEKNPFREHEIWMIMYQVLDALKHFQMHGIFHEDIRPNTIFVTENETMKIMDNKLVNNDQNAFFDAISGARSGYPAPELMVYIESGRSHTDYDKSKVDVWALGLTLIDLALLSRCFLVYDWDSFMIDFSKIDAMLKQMRTQNYSELLISTISRMLQRDSKKRETAQVLYDDLLKHYNQVTTPKDDLSLIHI